MKHYVLVLEPFDLICVVGKVVGAGIVGVVGAAVLFVVGVDGLGYGLGRTGKDVV